ncbi:TadE/TadG family type IV pilus assembly protein [Falsihalocynthiibacter sp. SS001]|uniref:TadE/TadG family type IV pilus assembly protein n=1 Tax=Falsihalocynthiibacter sp. SS001 TaxID=3349698 RepID=UPI0036D24120
MTICESKKKALQFVKNERGTATVEFVLILPAFLMLFSLLVDAALIFNGRTEALRTLQDANRKYSTGWFESTADLEDYIVASLASISPSAVATSNLSSGSIQSQVEFPSSELTIVGMVTGLLDINLLVRAEHVVEY